ncbi:MAG: GyrI-like domain-containing protein [Lachnospiraceae bacterium]|nr:GyrI-like domain-containing protein [Lachnospiraceae bacterium]
MAFDYKKEYREFYMPKNKPEIVQIPKANYIAVRGEGDPNEEGLCVQIMQIGPFDDEPATVAIMDQYLADNGFENDMTATRLHHEIYLSDARKVAPEKWKTVIRHPIKKSSHK